MHHPSFEHDPNYKAVIEFTEAVLSSKRGFFEKASLRSCKSSSFFELRLQRDTICIVQMTQWAKTFKLFYIPTLASHRISCANTKKLPLQTHQQRQGPSPFLNVPIKLLKCILVAIHVAPRKNAAVCGTPRNPRTARYYKSFWWLYM